MTVEELAAQLDALRAEFDAFVARANPVIDSHQPLPEGITPLMFPPPLKPQAPTDEGTP